MGAGRAVALLALLVVSAGAQIISVGNTPPPPISDRVRENTVRAHMANSTVTPPSPPARLQGPSAEPAAAPQEHITNLHPFLQPAPGPAPGAGALDTVPAPAPSEQPSAAAPADEASQAPAPEAPTPPDRGATQQVSVTEPDVPPPSPNSLPAGLSTPSGLDSESTKEAVGSGVGSTAAVGNSASHIAVPVLVAVAVVGAVAGGAFWYVRRSRRGYSRWSGLRDTEMSML